MYYYNKFENLFHESGGIRVVVPVGLCPEQPVGTVLVYKNWGNETDFGYAEFKARDTKFRCATGSNGFSGNSNMGFSGYAFYNPMQILLLIKNGSLEASNRDEFIALLDKYEGRLE